MTDLERFDRNARSKGVLVDANLLVLLIVGAVNRDRIPFFKRTSNYTSADWDLLTGILEQVSRRYAVPHVLSEVSALTDMKGNELDMARNILHRLIAVMQELPVSSLDACASPYYRQLGLTDAALGLAAKRQGCSVMTNDARLHSTLLAEGTSAVRFDDLRRIL